jgi:hypothetical protein
MKLENNENLSVELRSLSPHPNKNKKPINMEKLLNKLKNQTHKLLKRYKKKKRKISKKRNVNIQMENKIKKCLKEISEGLILIKDIDKNINLDVIINNNKKSIIKKSNL